MSIYPKGTGTPSATSIYPKGTGTLSAMPIYPKGTETLKAMSIHTDTQCHVHIPKGHTDPSATFPHQACTGTPSSNTPMPREHRRPHPHHPGSTVPFGAPGTPCAPSTWHGAVVGDEGSHVHGALVHAQVPHAAHEVAAADGEALGQGGHTAQQQRPRQIQRPAAPMSPGQDGGTPPRAPLCPPPHRPRPHPHFLEPDCVPCAAHE